LPIQAARVCVLSIFSYDFRFQLVPRSFNFIEFEVGALACRTEVFHEKAQKNEILKLEKLSRAEAEVRG